jgi:hypothetical protein
MKNGKTISELRINQDRPRDVETEDESTFKEKMSGLAKLLETFPYEIVFKNNNVGMGTDLVFGYGGIQYTGPTVWPAKGKSIEYISMDQEQTRWKVLDLIFNRRRKWQVLTCSDQGVFFKPGPGIEPIRFEYRHYIDTNKEYDEMKRLKEQDSKRRY